MIFKLRIILIITCAVFQAIMYQSETVASARTCLEERRKKRRDVAEIEAAVRAVIDAGSAPIEGNRAEPVLVGSLRKGASPGTRTRTLTLMSLCGQVPRLGRRADQALPKVRGPVVHWERLESQDQSSEG